jgi:plastocyanin
MEDQMRPKSRSSARWALLAASLPLALSIGSAAAAQSDDDSSPAMAVEISGLEPGATVTENEVAFTVSPVGFEFSAAHAGTPPVDGVGHYHVVLDGGLVNMHTTPEASLSMQNVAPGAHTLMVVPAMNNHMPVPDGAVAIEFDYQPTEALPEISSTDSAGGAPSITIESPVAGDIVAGDFEMRVSTTDFELSEALLGKPNVDGIGHWHVFVDAVDGMGTMMGMVGRDTFTVSTEALTPGTHTFFAVLVDNLHAPFDPPIATAVEVEVAAAAEEAAAAGGAVAVSLTEFALAPSALELSSGSYLFEGVNDGSLPHGLVIEGQGTRAGTDDISYPPGTSQSFSIDLAPGTYDVYCPVPGHKEAGMSGTITVAG